MTFPATIPARFLAGRPGGALLRVSSDAELDDAARLICAAYQRAEVAPPWPVHVVVLHHNLRWGELRAVVSGAEAAGKELGAVMASMGGMNVGT